MATSDFSDEELEIDAQDFAQILKTRMGAGVENQHNTNTINNNGGTNNNNSNYRWCCCLMSCHDSHWAMITISRQLRGSTMSSPPFIRGQYGV